MRGGIAVAVLGWTLAIAATAGAQAVAPQQRIAGALTRAGQVGIPVALLESKIAEGKAKGVSEERIAAAIERRLGALERASQALRGEADAAATLAVAADAMEAGVSEAVLKALAASAPGDRRNVAIAALTELVTRGQSAEEALARVRDALKRGPDALANLPADQSSGRSGSSRAQGAQGSSSGPGGGNSGSGSGNSGSGPGNSGSGSARGGPGSSSPPAAVPAPGQPSQAGRPDNSGKGRPSDPGRPDSPGRGNSGRQ